MKSVTKRAAEVAAGDRAEGIGGFPLVEFVGNEPVPQGTRTIRRLSYVRPDGDRYFGHYEENEPIRILPRNAERD